MRKLAFAMALCLLFGLTACSEQPKAQFTEKTETEIVKVEIRTEEKVSEPEPIYYEEPVYYEETYYEEPSYSGGYAYNNSFQAEGVRYEDGTRYTWYSQNVLPGGGLTELNNNGRHVDEETGFIKDADGNIAVASSDHAQGDIVETPWGPGKVYDSGCDSGTIDIYTDF